MPSQDDQSAVNLTLHNVNLPVWASTANRVVVNGEATRNMRPANVVEFVDFLRHRTSQTRSARRGRRSC